MRCRLHVTCNSSKLLLVLLVLYYVRRSSDADNEGVEGPVQRLTGLIGLSIGPAYVRQVSCWTTFIVIQ